MSLQKPAYPAPDGPPGEWDLDKLKHHCQTAVLLELHTIPLYMFSMYCVKPEDSSSASGDIMEIVKQEMLHLALAGNLLCAIGGQPVLYHPDHTPKYPCNIFYDNTELRLWPPHKDAIKMFAKVEQPFKPIKFPQGNVLPNYHSIGEFYQSLIDGMDMLDKRNPGKLFDASTASRQFVPDDGVYDDDGLDKITDLNGAVNALRLIIEQGEGATGEDPQIEPNHYNTFVALEKEDILHYPTVEDPQNLDSYAKGSILTAILASDAAYSYLLLTIEKCWTENNHRRDLIGNIRRLMRLIMKPIAEFLVTQQLDGREEHAAPPFKYFPFTSTESALSELKVAMKTAVDNYPQNAKLTFAAKGVNALFDLAQLNA